MPPAAELTRAQYSGWACCWCGAALWAGARSAGIARGRSGVHVLDVEVFECSPHCPAWTADPDDGATKGHDVIKICVSCDRSIKKGEAYTPIDKMSPSGAGTVLYRHAEPCTPVPVQTAQERGR
jgi:predicted RNA-binding Zn-ribbon protein involved in translation (DUF1610 family)